MATLTNLRRKRGAIHRAITTFNGTLEQWKENGENRDVDFLEAALESLQRSFVRFEDVQDAIEELDESEMPKREELQLAYDQAVGKAWKYLREYKAEKLSNETIKSSSPAVRKQPLPVTLPAITLPTFDGSIEGWSSFFDIFSSLIDQNESLSPVCKLHHLKASLTENAAKPIQALESTDGNYKVALAILKKKYSCTRRTVYRHWALLHEYPRLAKDTPVAINRFLETFYQHIRALENLQAPVEHWSVPLINLILSKIGSNTVWHWELTLTDDTMPHYKDLLQFLETRAKCSEFSIAQNNFTTSKSNVNQQELTRPHRPRVPSARAFATTNPQSETSKSTTIKHVCFVCSAPHSIYKCETFLAMTIVERRTAAKNLALCFNCLTRGHELRDCKSSLCRKCKKRHHTLLHSDENQESRMTATQSTAYNGTINNLPKRNTSRPQNLQQDPNAIALVVNSATSDLMVTAVVEVLNQKQELIRCRTLLDTCSTSNFMSEGMAATLGLQKRECNIPIGALNSLHTVSEHIVTATIRSRTNGYQRTLTFLIVPTISNMIPDQLIHRGAIKIPRNVRLADPDFHRPAPVDMLLGAGITLSLLCVGQLNASLSGGSDLHLQKTQLGWVIGGSAPASQPSRQRICNVTSQLHFDLTKFWEIEEGEPTKHLTAEEVACEEHFEKNVARLSDGRYSVALPFNSKKANIGESKTRALKRLRGIEAKLSRNPDLRQQYQAVLQEYLDLGHMSECQEDREHTPGFYLPHHAVLKESSFTTAVRVVFDGSAKSSTGISLNDTLLVGPTIQSELFALLVRFRKHCIVITGDIAKMYRQFLVHPQDRSYQRILWRNSQGHTRTFELNTVTFGLSAAPYLAIKCLHQLAEDEKSDFPQASIVLKEDFYVDDLLTGATTTKDAIILRDQLDSLLKRGGLQIRQWASNCPEVLNALPEASINRHLLLGDSTIKTLGVKWNSSNDAITYTVKPLPRQSVVTKRSVLSEIAKIFDPLGLLAPVITTAKILMQKLWSLQLNWDEALPASLHTNWINYHQDLQLLNNLEFDRKAIIDNPIRIELHGFCDASERAYGACVYTRSIDHRGKIYVTLLCAKSKVAPIKTVTIPRLELCGARLLTGLLLNSKEALQSQINQIYYWTDSTIVLQWLHTFPQSLKTFVANRVAEIQSKTDIEDWHHVRTHDNPADLVSRGQLPAELVQPSLWRHGPSWLSQPEDTWPKFPIAPVTDASGEKRRIHCFHAAAVDTSLLEKYSSIYTLQGVISYCMRFTPKNQHKGPITAAELTRAMLIICRLVQKTAFSEDINCLNTGKPLSPRSRLLTLNPFLDKNGLLRVGGRLKHATMHFAQRHPIIIPKSHHVTRLLIESEHRAHLHAGVQATLYALRRRYWIPDGRNEVRKVLRVCITCRKLTPLALEYIMGDLPSARVTQARPFCRVGIDYCGPFFIKEKRLRNRNQVKVYVAIFVCLTVKAVHLEVVSDLSTDAFLAAFQRFIARRGLCTDVYSDNGTNFVGAYNELRELNSLNRSAEHQKKFSTYAARHRITWHFIPARAPNFGGLWEAAVKSFKHHLRRVDGKTLLAYEEFNTFVIEIEAVLNSRPLTPIPSDPNDPIALTPGHFLIGDSLTSLPERELRDVPTNRLSSWQHIQQMRQHFWSRWHREYINELTVRHKWTKSHPEIKEDTVVLLKEDNLPPLQWIMGRVTKLHRGSDGVVRVVTVRTAKGTFDRSIRKLAPLPFQPFDDQPPDPTNQVACAIQCNDNPSVTQRQYLFII